MRLGRRLKRFAVGLLMVVGVIALVVVLGQASFHRIGTRKLAEITTRLDTEQPGWRLTDIEAARRAAAPPEPENSASTVLRLHREVTPAWDTHAQSETASHGVPSNHLPAFAEFLWLLQTRTGTAGLRDALRTELLRPELVARPGGYFPVTIAENPIATLLPHAQNNRTLVHLLDCDARLAALEGDPNRALRSARAGLVLARSLGDEPFLISQLVRIACTRVAVQSALQTLAWGQPSEGLVELQAELRAEADYPWLLTGLRGERGMVDQVFAGLESGKITADEFAAMGLGSPGPLQYAAFRLYKGLLPGDHAKALELLTAYIEAAKKPPHEQRAALAAIPLPPRPPDDFRYIVTSLMLPGVAKVGEAGARVRADLLTASAAIACERFRLANGRWPATLDEIPKSLLPNVPQDPYTGQPLLYRRLDDGVVVYVVGDINEQMTQRRREDRDPLADFGQGWKLWNPELRGLPAIPDGPPAGIGEAVDEPIPAPREVKQP